MYYVQNNTVIVTKRLSIEGYKLLKKLGYKIKFIF